MLFDEVMPVVSHAEFKVVMAVVRKTFGWNKGQDRISLSQLVKATGVSMRKVIDSVRSLAWIINTHKLANGTTEYSLNINVDTGKMPATNSELSTEGHAASAEANSELSTEGTELSTEILPQNSELSTDTKPTLKPTNTKANKKGTSNPDVRRFLDWWFDRYLQLFNVKYHITGKDGQLVKVLLRTYPLETMQKTASKLLKTDDSWLLKRGITIPTLAGEWNKLAATDIYRPGIDGPSLPDARDILAKEEERRRK